MRTATGFTLLELMVAAAIVTVVTVTAIPTVGPWIDHYRLKRAARELYSNLQLAKMTAIRTGNNCTVTFDQPVGGEVFDYVVFDDRDNDLELTAGEPVLRQVRWTDHKGIDDDSNTFGLNDDGLPGVTFRSNGFSTDNAGGFGNGTVQLRNARGKTLRVSVTAAANISSPTSS